VGSAIGLGLFSVAGTTPQTHIKEIIRTPENNPPVVREQPESTALADTILMTLAFSREW
jgi:hypothetical protein